MGLSEADTRAKLIDPGLHARGWKENLSAAINESCDAMRPPLREYARIVNGGLTDLRHLEGRVRRKIIVTAIRRLVSRTEVPPPQHVA
jgi:hypothetical protein